jgi:energy-coupling factor transporter ATP-binding protein EcfA2
MKISKIIIKGYQQFQNCSIDLTHPETGEPVEKVCFIGANGTGKSTILEYMLTLVDALSNFRRDPFSSHLPFDIPFVSIKVHTAEKDYFVSSYPKRRAGNSVLLDAEIEKTEEWQAFIADPTRCYLAHLPLDFLAQYSLEQSPSPPFVNGKDLIIHAASDQSLLLSTDPPSADLNTALSLFREFPILHSVSIENAANFWNLLIHLVKKRESDYQQFLKDPINKKRTVEAVEAEFERSFPEISKIWNRILQRAGLEFDIEHAKIPVQLNENLSAYIKLKSSGQPLNYNALSSGIRNYIFKLGHIRSLYFQRQVDRGFLLIDEPENSLYPDLLYGLIDEYLSITENTQLFVATHSPIIAAQFEPHERIHLDFDEQGFVTAKPGITPIGDDPNDLLLKDFQVPTVYGEPALRQWERFLELRELIPHTPDRTQKQRLMEEYLAIGRAYDFDPSSTRP